MFIRHLRCHLCLRYGCHPDSHPFYGICIGWLEWLLHGDRDLRTNNHIKSACDCHVQPFADGDPLGDDGGADGAGDGDDGEWAGGPGVGGAVPGGDDGGGRVRGLAVAEWGPHVHGAGDERHGDVPDGGASVAGGHVCGAVDPRRHVGGAGAERDADGGGHSAGAGGDESDAGERGGGDGGGDGAGGGQWVYARVPDSSERHGARDDVHLGDGADGGGDGQ